MEKQSEGMHRYFCLYYGDSDMYWATCRKEGNDFPDVKFNLDETWSFVNGIGVVYGGFEIGSGLRVPEGDLLWGPAFVGEIGNPAHEQAGNEFLEHVKNGTLTH